jgi:predicted AAA+ superfamily ATPase
MNAYLHYLDQAKIIALLHPAGSSTATLQKPEKIYLQNTSLMHALARGAAMTGSMRETFVQSMVSVGHALSAPRKGDFLVDGTYTLEVGGSSKDGRQIRQVDNVWLVKDGVEYGSKEVLPLWTLGMVY